MLKALRGQTWGASPETLLYSYRTYIRPLLEYSCILFSFSNDSLLKQIQAVETQAIKIAFRLAPWATNTSCYKLVTFPRILDRIKKLSKQFLETNKSDDLIEPLIKNSKMSQNSQHSSIYYLGINVMYSLPFSIPLFHIFKNILYVTPIIEPLKT